jgi:hypothetical protein
MRGFQYIPSSIGLECLMFPINWYTRVIRSNPVHAVAIGQVEIEHTGGRILWALDLSNQEKSLSSDLLDNLAVEAGLRGLHFLAAAAFKDECSYEALFNAGYSPSVWQKIWQYKTDFQTDDTYGFKWRKVRSSDLLSISLLQNKLLSPIEKTIVPPANKKPPAFILFLKETVCGYAYVMTSPDKVMITPIIEPEIPFAVSVLKILVRKFFRHIPVYYLVQTSSQRWIETAFADQIELIHPRHEIMVKHLAVHDKNLASNFNHSRSNRHTDVITPIIKTNGYEDNI